MPTTIDTPHLSMRTLPDREVRDVMTAGVVTIVEDASLTQVYRALDRHRVHALLVVGRHQGLPLGWVTARGLLAWFDRDPALVPARDAVVERAVTIAPGASLVEAAASLAREGVTHLLVSHAPSVLPEGVVSALDLARVAGRTR